MSAVPEDSGSGRLIPGTFLDNRYEIQRLLNSGGMGAVYLAYDGRLQIPCAIKQMFSVYSGDELQFVSEHFQQEAQLLARLHHQGIPRVLDYFQLPGESQYFLVMDYIEGKDLGTMIREREGVGFPEDTVTGWAVSVLDILIFLHSQPRPILHRDLKPSNIMIADPGRRVVLIDFGLAKTVNPESTSQKSFVGTWGYAPMEQCQGHPEPRSDLYALGATLHFLLSGKESLPFNFDPIRKECTDVSEKMEQILGIALQGSPEGRFASAADMKEALLGVLPQDKFPPISAGHAASGSVARPASTGNFPSGKPLTASTEQRSLFSVSGKLRKESDVIDAARAIEMGKAGNPKAAGKLMEVLLFGADADIRQQAAWALGKLKDENAVNVLADALRDEDPYVRRMAAWALGQIGSLATVPHLVALLGDKDLGVQKSAADALEQMGPREHVRVAIDAVISGDSRLKNLIKGYDRLCFNSPQELLIYLLRQPRHPMVFFHLGILFHWKGEPARARDLFTRAAPLLQGPEGLCAAGRVLIEEGRLEDAFHHFRLAFARDTDCSLASDGILEVSVRKGMQLQEARNVREELEAYQRGISLLGEHRDAWFLHGLFHFRRGKRREAEKVWEPYIAASPKSRWAEEASRLLSETSRGGIFSWLRIGQ